MRLGTSSSGVARLASILAMTCAASAFSDML
jgi:hypothetical protein